MLNPSTLFFGDEIEQSLECIIILSNNIMTVILMNNVDLGDGCSGDDNGTKIKSLVIDDEGECGFVLLSFRMVINATDIKVKDEGGPGCFCFCIFVGSQPWTWLTDCHQLASCS